MSEALEIMTQERGSHFDPSLFDCFMEMAGAFERIPREGAALKAMLLDKLSPYLAVSEISYLRHKLQEPEKVSAGGELVSRDLALK